MRQLTHARPATRTLATLWAKWVTSEPLARRPIDVALLRDCIRRELAYYRSGTSNISPALATEMHGELIFIGKAVKASKAAA